METIGKSHEPLSAEAVLHSNIGKPQYGTLQNAGVVGSGKPCANQPDVLRVQLFGLRVEVGRL